MRVLVSGIDVGVFVGVYVGVGVWVGELCAVGVNVDAWSADWGADIEQPYRNSKAIA